MKKNAFLQQKTDKEASASEKKWYQGMTKSLIFSIVETRLDIAFATSVTSHFIKNLEYQDTEAVIIILRYIKGSKKQGITYSRQKKFFVEGYLDFD